MFYKCKEKPSVRCIFQKCPKLQILLYIEICIDCWFIKKDLFGSKMKKPPDKDIKNNNNVSLLGKKYSIHKCFGVFFVFFAIN